MDQLAGSQVTPKKTGYIHEALREIRRKLERRKLRRQARQQQQERSAALIRLSQHAWEARIDLAAFPELRDQLTTIDRQTGDLRARIQQVESEQAALEARRASETSKFDAQRRAVDEQKRPVDASLQASLQNQRGWERAMQQSAARQSAVLAELGTLEPALTALASSTAPDHADKVAAAQARKEQLEAERVKLTGEIQQAQEALPLAKAEVQRLTAESQRLQAGIDAIEGERRKVLGSVTAELQRVGNELATARQQMNALAGVRTQHFLTLGMALYQSGTREPALAEDVQQIASGDLSSAATAQSLEASLALSRAVPRGTMLKFWATVILLPLLLIGIGFGTFAGYDWWRQRKLATQFELPTPVNPYLAHPLARHPAYLLADQLTSARSEAAVRDLTLEAFRKIHLGVYTHDGRQILAGAERSDKDFFLYDFQWKTLARAYYRHDVTDYTHHSALLGKALLESDDSAKVEAELGKSILQRYQNAQNAPDDPSSFLILLVDGLARQQLRPYSLSEVASRPGKDLLVDPLQSFLIMLDFFVQQPHNSPATAHWWQRQLVPSVYAESPCSIVGDQGQTGWGWGMKAGGLASQTVGKGTQIAGAVGDLILLYGVTINISPTYYRFHLRHDVTVKDSFIALVTFEPDGIPTGAIQCGWLAGKIMPQAGERLKDVELTWNIEPVWPPYLLVTHETVQELTGHLGFQTKTDSDGSSIFEIEALDCPHKKDGNVVVGRDLMMTATARMLTTKMPTPGTLGWISLLTKLGPSGLEYLMNGRTGYCRFRAEWHEKSPKRPQRS